MLVFRQLWYLCMKIFLIFNCFFIFDCIITSGDGLIYSCMHHAVPLFSNAWTYFLMHGRILFPLFLCTQYNYFVCIMQYHHFLMDGCILFQLFLFNHALPLFSNAWSHFISTIPIQPIPLFVCMYRQLCLVLFSHAPMHQFCLVPFSHPFMHPSIYPSIHPSIHLSIDPSSSKLVEVNVYACN